MFFPGFPLFLSRTGDRPGHPRLALKKTSSKKNTKFTIKKIDNFTATLTPLPLGEPACR